jgi:hypothetical protein
MVKVLRSWVCGPLESYVAGFVEDLAAQGYRRCSAEQRGRRRGRRVCPRRRSWTRASTHSAYESQTKLIRLQLRSRTPRLRY